MQAAFLASEPIKPCKYLWHKKTRSPLSYSQSILNLIPSTYLRLLSNQPDSLPWVTWERIFQCLWVVVNLWKGRACDVRGRSHKAPHKQALTQRPLFELPFLQLVCNNSPSALPDTDEALNSPCLLSQQAKGELMSSLSSSEWSITSCNYK